MRLIMSGVRAVLWGLRLLERQMVWEAEAWWRQSKDGSTGRTLQRHGQEGTQEVWPRMSSDDVTCGAVTVEV